MQNHNESLTAQQKQLLSEAITNVHKEIGLDAALEGFKQMYFYSQEHFYFDHGPSRMEVQQVFLLLHDMLAVAEMVVGKKEGCHLLAV